jgi:monoamine oxidase
MKNYEIIIIGAGACGLMAARELSLRGKKILILEARKRTGGRIYSLEENSSGYISEAGAEFVHGDLPFTRSLVKEAGLTLLPSEGQFWNTREGDLTQNREFIPNRDILIKKLLELKEDMPIEQFLEQNFPKETNSEMYHSIKGFVEGYDAADPSRASTLALRDEWISENEAQQYRIQEGYGALINFLEIKCSQNDVEIILDSEVASIHSDQVLKKTVVECAAGKIFEALQVILTVPLPILKKINFTPPLPQKMKAASEIGYGKVIKFLFRFKDRWWEKIQGKDLSKAGFIFSRETVPTWWTQYPEKYPILTGWLAGPKAEKFINTSSEELLDIGLISLSRIFKMEKEKLKKELLHSKVINWGSDPYALGAYAYATPESGKARNELLNSVNHMLYFSGEALYKGKEMGTVEAALASGFQTAEKILNQY